MKRVSIIIPVYNAELTIEKCIKSILQQDYNYSSDFFALGVIGYEFMQGNRPFYAGNKKQRQRKRKHKKLSSGRQSENDKI